MSSANTFKQIKANFKDTYSYPSKPNTAKLYKKLRASTPTQAPKSKKTGK